MFTAVLFVQLLQVYLSFVFESYVIYLLFFALRLLNYFKFDYNIYIIMTNFEIIVIIFNHICHVSGYSLVPWRNCAVTF